MDPTFGPTFSMMVVTAVAGAAAWSLTLWWLREPQPAPPPSGPLDADPHIVTVLGPGGHPNPLKYERVPTYAAALARQRELDRHGHASIITHADSGQVRMDWSIWLGPYHRISL